MAVCNGASLTAFSADACVRDLWSAVIPFAFVGLTLLSFTPLARVLLRAARKPFTNFLPLHEAEALISGDHSAEEEEAAAPLWRTLVLSIVSLVECLLWVGVACYSLITNPQEVWNGIGDILTATTWFYATLRLVVKPTATVPYDLLVLFGLHLVLGTVTFFGHLYDSYVYALPLPSWTLVSTEVVNLFIIAGVFTVIVNMPLGIPSKQVKKGAIGASVSPEDYTTLWGWASFRWLIPLVTRGITMTLNETDVWAMSPTMQARPLHIKFSRSTGKLLKRLWETNSLDLILDFTLSYVSIVFNYAGPFFLKQILDSLDGDGRDPEKRALAFVYAFLAFASSLCKTECDLQHLWYGRRACTRIRTEIMASIYDKALKRKDFSGVVDKDAMKKPEGTSKKPNSTADDPKAGADIGKIVNMMAGDASRISMLVATIYFMYGAPFELLIAGVFLYQLLGWSAFTGIFVIILIWPLNNFVAKRAIRIQKGVLTARDKRMGVLNELIGAVKFIKFFAWENRWIQKVLDSREVEMQWMIKARINSICFSLIGICAPILVSVSAFFVYVASGNELTIGTAFTAIALFQMVRIPLNVIPSEIVQILQAKVSLDRIATYLDEEEVSEQVSTLKKGRVPPSEESDAGLGIVHGTFKWNEVEERKDDNKSSGKDGPNRFNSVANANGSGGDTCPSGEASTIVDSASAMAGSTGDHRFQLQDVTIMFPDGQLTVVTGPTASGKTALLMALLGELTTLEGRIVMSKNASRVDEHGLAQTISYAAQSPWLRHQSIKDNILFGYTYDEERYEAVVACCALKPDLEMLEDGDATEIGVRGVSLSGGQKARVALARAVYARTKYVLLDDPLSAVDSHTARFLYEKLFKGYLLTNRTVILVTHHVELVLPGTYYLVRMLDGRIDTQGTVQDLRASGILDDIIQFEETEAHKEEQAVEEVERKVDSDVDIDGETSGEVEAAPKDHKKPRKLVEDEHRETGGVKWRIYNTYLEASSYWTWGILLVLILLAQVLGIGEKIWIKIWGDAYGATSSGGPTQLSYTNRGYAELQHVLGDGLSSLHQVVVQSPGPSFNTAVIKFPPAQQHPYFYIGIYTAIAFSAGLVNIAGVITQVTGALRASRILFDRLLRTVVRATMRWHDVTPQGRMLNRFSKDVETVDSSLASTLQSVNQSFALFAVSIITIIVVFPLFIIPATILGFFYRRVAIAYLNTGRDIRRMESNTRSPIFANFSELLEGIVTVRAFGAEQRFLDDLYTKIDLTTVMWYTYWMLNRWLLLTFDTLGAATILATTLFALSGYVDAGLAGVCITSAMSFTTSVYWVCRYWTTLELDLNSVERVVEYLDLPQEPPAIIESNRPPAYWPSSTSMNKDSLLVVDNLVIKYAPELPAVIRGISFSLKAKERVGLLGRTGSGKSTLAMSLLRFADPASGRIVIDGIDISTIGLHDLRSRLTFIPQDATLFSGTLRDNLDPFSEHTDAECLDVLDRVQMLTDSQRASQHASREASRAASRAGSLPEHDRQPTIASASTSPTETAGKTVITLDTQVSPGGTNFSQGQRQLIAMARALLRRSAIIILDEATSSIDFATDAKIQATIREEFGDSLLLTVAHRLRTVIDYDRLIVLDKGELAEFDTPLNLIQKEGGIFRSMCLKSGTFAELETAAKEKAARDRQAASQV
ncbi:ATP-dependent bile acid permease [Trametes pubescens]|uniref:ATP-dependent bile acid permease n=1 Tax=Trametes pubescens TaxID=154538 RepID=A0A1M2VDZ5_TRAPU|nr:ATP-dependent bile acid permease [Trametes pubescens]